MANSTYRSDQKRRHYTGKKIQRSALADQANRLRSGIVSERMHTHLVPTGLQFRDLRSEPSRQHYKKLKYTIILVVTLLFSIASDFAGVNHFFSNSQPIETPRSDLQKSTVIQASVDRQAHPFKTSSVITISTVLAQDGTSQVQTQTLQQPRSTTKVLGYSVAGVSGLSGQPIKLEISLSGQVIGSDSFLIVQGLPDSARLSAGQKVGGGKWMLVPDQIKGLNIIVPKEYVGDFNVKVLLFDNLDAKPLTRIIKASIKASRSPPQPMQVTEDGTKISQGKIQLSSTNPSHLSNRGQLRSNDVTNTDDADSLVVQKKKFPISTSMSPVEVRTLLARSKVLLNQGEIAGARLILEHVALSGSAPAALALAKSYDPVLLSPLRIMGIKPNIERAIKWYKFASSLGNREAESILRKLAQKNSR